MAAYPLVPRDEVGFRIQVTAANTDAEIEHLISALGELTDRFQLQTAESWVEEEEEGGVSNGHPGLSTRTYGWGCYVAGATLLSLAYLFGRGQINSSGPVFNIIGLSAVAAILIGTRGMPRGRRLPWYLFALGQTLFVSGDVLAYNYERIFGTGLPFPSVGDALYLLVYPFIVAGIMLLIRRRPPRATGRRDRLTDHLDRRRRAVVGLPDRPVRHLTGLDWLTKSISVAYPVGDGRAPRGGDSAPVERGRALASSIC